MPAKLLVRLVAPDFVIQGAAEMFLEVPVDRNSDVLPFLLTANRRGEHRINVEISTAGAMDAFGPAAGNEIGFASILVGEHVVKLLICKLFYRLDAGHVGLPYSVGATYAI